MCREFQAAQMDVDQTPPWVTARVLAGSGIGQAAQSEMKVSRTLKCFVNSVSILYSQVTKLAEPLSTLEMEQGMSAGVIRRWCQRVPKLEKPGRGPFPWVVEADGGLMVCAQCRTSTTYGGFNQFLSAYDT